MNATAADDALTALGRALGLGVLAVGAALALFFAAAAAVVVGLMIAGAALALRFAPRPAPAGAPEVLTARRTPTGWVVEADTKRKA